jgi:c-di-GMP-binding flagellar brake protein YcgR
MSLTPKPPSSRRTAWTHKRPRWRAERRDLERVPVALFLDEYVDDRPHRALTTNISATGLYMHRVAVPGRQFGRDSNYVQLELALPGTRDTIWARGQIRYDDLGMDFVHGTGVQLTDIARGHQRLLRDFLYERKKKQLEELLQLIRANRYH